MLLPQVPVEAGPADAGQLTQGSILTLPCNASFPGCGRSCVPPGPLRLWRRVLHGTLKKSASRLFSVSSRLSCSISRRWKAVPVSYRDVSSSGSTISSFLRHLYKDHRVTSNSWANASTQILSRFLPPDSEGNQQVNCAQGTLLAVPMRLESESRTNPIEGGRLVKPPILRRVSQSANRGKGWQNPQRHCNRKIAPEYPAKRMLYNVGEMEYHERAIGLGESKSRPFSRWLGAPHACCPRRIP